MSGPSALETGAGAAPLVHFVLGEGHRQTVLVHGFLGSGRNLRTLALGWSAREPDRRFVIPDLRGHGDSPPLDPGADLESLARDVLDTATAAGIRDRFALVGHSLGGRVALSAARLAPERLSEVVLLDISPSPIDPATSESRTVLDVLLRAPDSAGDRREMRAFLLGQGLTPALADWVLMNLRPEDGRYTWRLDRAALDALHDRTAGADLWPLLAGPTALGTQVPVRCVRGGRSRYVSDADAVRLEALGCRVDTLADAGHYVHIDALEALLDLLSNQPRGVR